MSGAARGRTLAYGAAIAIIVFDQWVKHWIVGDLRLADGQTLALWGPLHLTLVRNPGVAYGLLRSHAQWSRWALSVFELAVAVALIVWAWRNRRTFLALAIGLVMGGAVGNLIDRVRNGAVVDFIDLQGLHFPWVFNLADSAITVGIALLIAESLFAPRDSS
ncbi:MAG TPA: signal peptidase II [Caulobacteraceae bacterium]